MCNALTHSPNCTCGFGGDTRSGTVFVPPTRPVWYDLTEKKALGRPTLCWWCGEHVYFHRDQNGGCALLEFPLGRPWQVHGCWRDHQEQRNNALQAIAAELEISGYDGNFYPNDVPLLTRPDDQNDREVILNGYVADNHYFYRESPIVRVQSAKSSSTVSFSEVDVSDGSKGFRFLIPSASARLLPDYSVVQISGYWRRRKRHWLLIAKEVVLLNQHYADQKMECVAQERELKCHYCHEGIQRSDSWGLDIDRNIECGKCGRS